MLKVWVMASHLIKMAKTFQNHKKSKLALIKLYQSAYTKVALIEWHTKRKAKRVK